MLKIGVLSDTHIHDLRLGAELATRLVEHWFADVDLILHAGDVVHPGFLDLFGDCPVQAVRGNMDPAVPGIPLRRVLHLGGFRIGLIHGWGEHTTLERRVCNEFHGVALDCLIYGHSHQPVCHRVGPLLLFNPGSAADRRSAPAHTVGLLEISDRIEGRIVTID